MPVRPFSRDRDWLLPPSLNELVPLDHPVRFVAGFVDAIDSSTWSELGIVADGKEFGAPSYQPRMLVAVWLYGFLSGIRSSRRLEVACTEQVPLMWLTGRQAPDHNTLWRFYQAHRTQMRKLFKRTVRIAVGVGLVDLAVQALDGTRIAANATGKRSFHEEGLQKLLEKTEKVISDLEAKNQTGGEPVLPRLPRKLLQARELQAQVKAAMERVQAEEGPKTVNLTDEDAALVKGRQGVMAGYNAQAVVSALRPEVAKGSGRLITAQDVVTDAHDQGQLIPMLEQAEANMEQRAGKSLTDGGYHSGVNLEECAKKGYEVLMPEAQSKAIEDPYHKDHFGYDAEKDCYTCPEGQCLSFSWTQKDGAGMEVRVYEGSPSVCRACPRFGKCTKDNRHGRRVRTSAHEEALRRHRALMAKDESKAIYGRRKELVELVFGILKEVQGARRFLLRGLDNVRSEWALLATAFNLRTLWRVWRRYAEFERSRLCRLAP